MFTDTGINGKNNRLEVAPVAQLAEGSALRCRRSEFRIPDKGAGRAREERSHAVSLIPEM